MATIRFYTRSTSKVDMAPVWIRFTDGRQTNIRFKTPFKMVPDYWNEEKQSLKQRILYSDIFNEAEAKDIEDKFVQLKDYILREHFKLTAPASKEWLKSVINKFYYKDEPVKKETLNQYIKRYIDEATSGERLNSGNPPMKYDYGSLRVLRGFMLSFNHFQGVVEEEKKDSEGNVIPKKRRGKEWPKQPYKPLDFNDINQDFYKDFVKYFYSRGCSGNYIGKHIKSLKTLMRKARQEGLHNNLAAEQREFKTISEPSDSIYLSEAEIKKLYDLDLSDNKVQQIVRDVFLCGVYTAQRYSDYSKINKSNIKMVGNKKVIELVQQKTGEKCIIPIRPELETILKRYDYNLPKTFEQKVNENIKKIGLKAKITEIINIEKNQGGLKVKTKVKKYELIKTHSARRSGCTNMYLAGIPTIDIMKISGHKTETEFLKYIKVSKEETAIALSNHPYFIGNPLSLVK